MPGHLPFQRFGVRPLSKKQRRRQRKAARKKARAQKRQATDLANLNIQNVFARRFARPKRTGRQVGSRPRTKDEPRAVVARPRSLLEAVATRSDAIEGRRREFSEQIASDAEIFLDREPTRTIAPITSEPAPSGPDPRATDVEMALTITSEDGPRVPIIGDPRRFARKIIERAKSAIATAPIVTDRDTMPGPSGSSFVAGDSFGAPSVAASTAGVEEPRTIPNTLLLVGVGLLLLIPLLRRGT